MKVDLVNKPLDVETQRTIEDCVPDIHLIQDGTTLAVIELKFDAPLTPNQSSGRYSQVVGRGRVIFIVPEERKSEFDALVSVQGITLLSWRDVFARLEKYVIDATDRDSRLFLAALVHLKEFCKVIEQSRFIPFSNEQLVCPQTDLSIEKHLVWITSEVLIKAKEDHVFQEVGRLTAGYDETFYYGQNVMINGYRVWFGYWPLAWRLHPAKGPLWMQYSGRDLKRFIHSFPEHSVHKIPDNEVALPVWVADANMSNTQEEEVENVLARIKDAVIRLKAVDPLVN